MSFTEGLKEFKAGRYARAVEFFSLVTDRDDQNHKAWNAMGVCFSSLGKYEEADRCFQNAIGILPSSDVYMRNRMKNRRKIETHHFSWEAEEEEVSCVASPFR